VVMRLLIADTLESWGVEEFRNRGFDVAYEPSLEGDALQDALARTRAEVLVVRSTRVTASMLEAAPALGLVVRAGAGVNTIDVAAASRRSIFVANCPGKNAVAVAELTFALILAVDRRIVENVVDLRNGRWNKKAYSKARGLKGRTLGIVGLGAIGKAVAERARAFEMPVVAWSRSLGDAEAAALNLRRCASPGEVAAHCDILTIHLAAAPGTARIIDAEVLQRLAPGSYLINTARAEVLDYDALREAIEQRHLRVGLDVYPGEPAVGEGAFVPSILNAGGVVYGTHHIGASTEQAQDATVAEAVRIVGLYRDSGQVLNCVNIRASSGATFCLRVRHCNRPGVLAHVLNLVSHAGVNVEEMDNVICEGGESACAQILLDESVPLDVLDRIQAGNPYVLGVTLSPRRL